MAAWKLTAGLANDSGSIGDSPVMQSRNSATSVILRAIGPRMLNSLNGKLTGPRPTRPGLQRRPTTEQKLAGLRSDPPRSEPLASQAMPLARATADPPDEPAQLLLVSQGLTVAPKTSLKVLAPAPNSGVLVLA